MRYRIREPFVAVRPSDGNGFQFLTLHPGDLIVIRGSVQESGLVDVVYDGVVIAAFMRDIEARAELEAPPVK